MIRIREIMRSKKRGYTKFYLMDLTGDKKVCGSLGMGDAG
jgi:hypothetical protein